MRLSCQALGCGSEFKTEMVQVAATDILEFNMFEIVPNAFIGIQVRRIARQAFQPDALGGAGGQEGLDVLTAMNRSAIPDDQQLASNGVEQLLQEGDDGDAVERFGLHGQVDFTCGRDGADHRIVVVRQLAAQNRRLAHRRPGAHHAGQQIEGGFIDEQNRAPLGYGSFFSSGHVTASHSAMAASLRWLARTIGRCGLHPSCRSKGPM